MRKLATADRMLNKGKDIAGICRELQVSEQTYYRWRNQFGGMNADDAKQLKDLDRENATLKRLLANAELEKAALKGFPGGRIKTLSAMTRIDCERLGVRVDPYGLAGCHARDPRSSARSRPARLRHFPKSRGQSSRPTPSVTVGTSSFPTTAAQRAARLRGRKSRSSLTFCAVTRSSSGWTRTR